MRRLYRVGNLPGMKLQTYLASLTPSERDAFAARINSTPGYVKLLRSGHKRVGHAMAKRILVATDGQVTLHEMRPDIWAPSAGQAA